MFTSQTYALGVIFESPLAACNYRYLLVQKDTKNMIAVTNSQFLEGKICLMMDPVGQAAIANASHAEIDALTCEKRGLMQKLLSGEWRVSQ